MEPKQPGPTVQEAKAETAKRGIECIRNRYRVVGGEASGGVLERGGKEARNGSGRL